MPPSSLSPLVPRSVSSGAPPSGPCGSFSRDRLAVVGELVVAAGAGWAARTSLAQKLPETPGGPRASAGSQWAESGSRVGRCGAWGPRSSVNLLEAGPVPDQPAVGPGLRVP